jgi:hypothetical protein
MSKEVTFFQSAWYEKLLIPWILMMNETIRLNTLYPVCAENRIIKYLIIDNSV